MPTELTTLNSQIEQNKFFFIDNYIYLYHIGAKIYLPSFVDSVTDSQPVTFSQSSVLSRSAPIYSYQNSGPRSVQVSFNLHRDLLTQINLDNTTIPAPGDDYVDLFIRYVQAATLPSYEVAQKMVNPPIVALRLGNDIYIKGVLTGNLGLTYQYPILENGKYANVLVSLSISEIDPYDAKMVTKIGSYRYVSETLERTITTTLDDLTNTTFVSNNQNYPVDNYGIEIPGLTSGLEKSGLNNGSGTGTKAGGGIGAMGGLVDHMAPNGQDTYGLSAVNYSRNGAERIYSSISDSAGLI